MVKIMGTKKGQVRKTARRAYVGTPWNWRIRTKVDEGNVVEIGRMTPKGRRITTMKFWTDKFTGRTRMHGWTKEGKKPARWFGVGRYGTLAPFKFEKK